MPTCTALVFVSLQLAWQMNADCFDITRICRIFSSINMLRPLSFPFYGPAFDMTGNRSKVAKLQKLHVEEGIMQHDPDRIDSLLCVLEFHYCCLNQTVSLGPYRGIITHHGGPIWAHHGPISGGRDRDDHPNSLG